MKMYKLFVTRVTKRISSHGVCFLPKQVVVQHSIRLCSFCNFYHRNISKFVKHHQIRTSTTTANILDDEQMKKKAKQTEKKYTELLAVRNDTKKEKLTVSNLSMLVDPSDFAIDINEDYHYSFNNRICNTESDLDIRTRNEVKLYNELNYSEEFVNIDEHESKNVTPNKKPISPPKKKMSQKGRKLVKDIDLMVENTSKQKKPEIKKVKSNRYVTEDYIDSLLMYMQVYLRCGLLKRAKNTLMRYRKLTENNLKTHNKCINLYNVVLEVYASKKMLVNVLELYNMIKEDSLTPTPQTYAYLFDAFGRITMNEKNHATLQHLKIEMESYNISLDDIFNKSCFKNDQQENVLKAIRSLVTDFTPSYTNLSTGYTCELLSKFPSRINYESPVHGFLTMEELKDLVELQFRNECAIEVQIPSIAKQNKKAKTVNLKNKVEEMENCWRQAVLEAFERNLKALKQRECESHKNLMVLYPFLEVLDREHYVNAIFREIRQLATGSETFSTSLKSLYIILGRYIHKIYEIETKKRVGVFDKIIRIYWRYLEWYLNPKSMSDLSTTNNRTVWQQLELEETRHGTTLNAVSSNWPIDVIIKVGKFLYDIILNDIILQPKMLKGHDLKCSIPAFYSLFRNRGSYLSEQIKPHPFVSKLYKESQSDILTFDSILLPCHGPPNPWVSIYSGGYLITKTEFIRITDHTDRPWRLLQTTPTEQLFPIFDSLNQLSSIPWKVNVAILDIVIQIFRDGGSVEFKVPQSISELPAPNPIDKNATPKERSDAAAAMARYKQLKYDKYSLWCDTLYKLSIADHFRNKMFWLPHNVDFRGRVYPVPPYLNHLSSDLGRALLLFAKGKPLGPKGLDWLKLHVINLTNMKKGTSVDERINFANENLENILDSAANPLTGKKWWLQSEEPWQTLAGCMEIAAALKAPNVEEYVSMFPVHQDGSCNGLQHYAALGRDQIGAESVNLSPLDRPKDVYSTVATIVEKQRQIDAANNNKLAQLLDGFVKRKVIKQTVMTTVYGVTKYGAKLQIAKQLRDMPDFPEEDVWPASFYLTESTFHSLRTMFKSAREIQDWFTECAQIISTVCSENVEWVTPLGLPIVQPYVKPDKGSRDGSKKTDSKKQRNAFAPNFIHSLDSTHMMLTSLHCDLESVTFVSVHDCFWSHPCTVDIMNKICRQQFLALHSQPILENLAKSFVERYSPIYTNLSNALEIKNTLNRVPSKGSFDIRNVLSSVYFFN